MLIDVASKWFDAKRGRVTDLHRVAGDEECEWYECPCGVSDHLASAFWIHEGYSRVLSNVLTCPINHAQWLIERPCVEDAIHGEEARYLRLIESAAPIVRRVIERRGMSEGTLAFLHDTHGIDAELVHAIRGDDGS